MANDHNRFSFIGNLVKDCEMTYTNTGKALVKFSIACNEKYGETEKVHFFNIDLWGKFAQAVQPYLNKGQKVFVAGKVKQDRWQADDGKTRSKIVFTATELQLVGGKKEQGSNSSPAPSTNDADVPFEDDIPI